MHYQKWYLSPGHGMTSKVEIYRKKTKGQEKVYLSLYCAHKYRGAALIEALIALSLLLVLSTTFIDTLIQSKRLWEIMGTTYNSHQKILNEQRARLPLHSYDHQWTDVYKFGNIETIQASQ